MAQTSTCPTLDNNWVPHLVVSYQTETPVIVFWRKTLDIIAGTIIHTSVLCLSFYTVMMLYFMFLVRFFFVKFPADKVLVNYFIVVFASVSWGVISHNMFWYGRSVVCLGVLIVIVILGALCKQRVVFMLSFFDNKLCLEANQLVSSFEYWATTWSLNWTLFPRNIELKWHLT